MNKDYAVGAKTGTDSPTPSNKRRPGPLSSSVFPAGVQQLLVIKEEVSPEWCPSLDQEDPKPLHIKEEQEELWTSQEGEQLHGVEEADITKFPFTAVTVKSEDDEEKPQTSQLHLSQTEENREAEPPASSSATRIKTETDGEDCGGCEPARNRDPVIHADFQQLLVINEVVSPEWRPSLDQEDPDTVHIKEELCNSQEGEQLHGQEDAYMTSFPFTAVTVKSEDDEKKPQSSQLHLSQVEENRDAEPPASSSTTQIKTETDREDCGGSEPARNRDQDSRSQPNNDEKASDCSGTGVGYDDWQEPLSNSGPETEDSDSGGEETRAPKSGVNALRHKDAPVSDVGCDTGKKPYSCFECGDGFHYKGSLQRHMCHLGNRSSCSLANKKCCGIKQKVDSEIRVHTGKTPFACVLCRKKFTHQQSLKRHIRVHTGEKPFGCEVCVKTFKHQESLKRHMRVHTGEKPFGCDVCRKTFDNQQSLKRHMRVHTGEKPFGCDVCGKSFKEQGKLKRHMRVHTGEKPFGCDVCSKRFTHQESLKKHTRIHTGEKPFNCDVCGKRFTHQESLKKHMRIHTGEKPFGCDVCNKTFTLQDSLKKHIRVHTGEKPFGCNVCGKRFTEQGNLNKHTRIHLGEKPFGCSVCSKRFTEQGRLKKHVRVHTGEKKNVL
ncbi:uncharacterized protein [Pagrus major]|uniref:uncharacterized protein isoform X1 n=1 Tax=Pagrus major TaxID=143350 RepID=UPI003CC88E21